MKDKWKPNKYETYYYPDLGRHELFSAKYWDSYSTRDQINYLNGIVCKTQREAVVLAEKLIQAIKDLGVYDPFINDYKKPVDPDKPQRAITPRSTFA